jgi:DNA-binding LacI/PurR family transcriptional regulator
MSLTEKEEDAPMSEKTKVKAEVKLLLALACGATAEQAARQAGVSVRTVYRRLKNQQFWRQVQAMRADMVQRASGTLTAAGAEAVKTLLELLRAPTPFHVRLGAARGILEMGLRVREDVEIAKGRNHVGTACLTHFSTRQKHQRIPHLAKLCRSVRPLPA